MEWPDTQVDGWMDGMDGWRVGMARHRWIDGWMEGWTSICPPIHPSMLNVTEINLFGFDCSFKKTTQKAFCLPSLYIHACDLQHLYFYIFQV